MTRSIKLLKDFKGIKRLILTLYLSMPAIINVTSLIFLSNFIFSILACFLFKDLTFINENGYCILNFRKIDILYRFQVLGVNNLVGFSNF